MRNERIQKLCLAGLLSAAVFVLTAYLHIPSHTGYTHIGDAVIFLAATILPLPYAVSVAVIGASLADLLTGYAIWAPASVIIKALIVLPFSHGKSRIITLRNLLSLIPAVCLTVGGYYLYEAILTQNAAAALLGIPGYITQFVLSSVLFIAVGTAIDNIKNRKTKKNGDLKK